MANRPEEVRYRDVACAFLRVHPRNIAALRCFAAAGFEPVGPDQAAIWNAGQPHDYVWLTPP